jgi:hypothetical protein
MFFEKKLRKLQDNIRNKGWRIDHISWLPQEKLECYNPKTPSTWLLIILGFICFFGGPVLLSKPNFSIWSGISIMVFGLVLLISSRYTAGLYLYGRFVPVEAVCIDREVREFIDPDSIGSLIKNTFWKPRILCKFQFQGCSYQVTPIIVKIFAFNTKEEVHCFLDKRIDENGKCTLWINPKNPLHTVFHRRPRTGPYTV